MFQDPCTLFSYYQITFFLTLFLWVDGIDSPFAYDLSISLNHFRWEVAYILQFLTVFLPTGLHTCIALKLWCQIVKSCHDFC